MFFGQQSFANAKTLLTYTRPPTKDMVGHTINALIEGITTLADRGQP